MMRAVNIQSDCASHLMRCDARMPSNGIGEMYSGDFESHG